MLKQSTDADYVEAVRRIQPLRRRVGATMIAAGMALFLVGAGGLLYLVPKVKMAVEVLRDQERAAPSDFNYTVTIVLGAVLGATTGMATTASLYTTLGGILYRRRDRTADLLIQCWDQLAAKRPATAPDPDFS
ncbi:hypothetical protein AYO47_00215 [Planctomyces sp. SCGC AG-212-M04]|nr:hypothetical protein AYO47_00215 [Planctomyces sp. SCGC AG-212-M04]